LTADTLVSKTKAHSKEKERFKTFTEQDSSSSEDNGDELYEQ